MNTIKTRLHSFRFDLLVPAEKSAWLALRESLSKGPREMESHGGGSHCYNELPAGGAVVELETAHIFDNQWNTAASSPTKPNHRIFDFAFDYKPNGNADIRRGHYLEQTAEMQEIRRNIFACGYCGKQEPAQKGYVFCPHCMGSEHLTEKDLRLTRMLPAGESFNGNRPELSESEKAHLLPIWRDAQINGGNARDKARIAKARESVAKDYESAIRKATMERDGKTWLMDRGINTANIIYYSHTGRWSWGWREKVSATLLPDVMEKLKDFPFPFDIEKA